MSDIDHIDKDYSFVFQYGRRFLSVFNYSVYTQIINHDFEIKEDSDAR